MLADLLYAIPPEDEDEEDGFSPEAKAWFQEDRQIRADLVVIIAMARVMAKLFSSNKLREQIGLPVQQALSLVTV